MIPSRVPFHFPTWVKQFGDTGTDDWFTKVKVRSCTVHFQVSMEWVEWCWMQGPGCKGTASHRLGQWYENPVWDQWHLSQHTSSTMCLRRLGNPGRSMGLEWLCSYEMKLLGISVPYNKLWCWRRILFKGKCFIFFPLMFVKDRRKTASKKFIHRAPRQAPMPWIKSLGVLWLVPMLKDPGGWGQIIGQLCSHVELKASSTSMCPKSRIHVLCNPMLIFLESISRSPETLDWVHNDVFLGLAIVPDPQKLFQPGAAVGFCWSCVSTHLTIGTTLKIHWMRKRLPCPWQRVANISICPLLGKGSHISLHR